MLYVVFFISIMACDRYNPVQDEIPDVPRETQAYSTEAMNLAIRMIELYPEEPLYKYKKGVLHLQRQEWSAAVEAITQALKYDSLNVSYRFSLATAHHAQEDYKKALQIFQRILPKIEDDFESLVLVGELYYTQKEYDNATKYLNKALKITSHEAKVYYWKGTVALARLDTATAIQNLNIALQRKPSYALVYNAFAEMYNRYDLPTLAITYVNKGLQYDAKASILYFTKAEAFRIKRFSDDSARLNYEKAYRLNRKLHMAGYYLGKYTYEAGKYEEAKRYFEAVVRQEPVFATAYYYLGMCLRMSGNKEEALKKLGMAIKQDAKLLTATDMYWAISNEIQQERYYRYEDSLRRISQVIDTTKHF